MLANLALDDVSIVVQLHSSFPPSLDYDIQHFDRSTAS